MKRKLTALLLGLLLVAAGAVTKAQISVPNTLTSGTKIQASPLNTNFSTIADAALNRTGGNLTGNLTANEGVTIDGVDIGASVCLTCTASFKNLSLVSPTSGVTVNGVNIIDSNGKLAALSSTYLADLSGANLTGLNAANITTGSLPLARLGLVTPSAYTPTWGNTGTANTAGASSLSGYYIQVGKLVFYRVFLSWGAGTASGNGQWTFTLPVTADSFGGVSSDIVMFDTSANSLYRGESIASSTTVILAYTSASPMAAVGSTAPFTWATGDTITISGWYIAA